MISWFKKWKEKNNVDVDFHFLDNKTFNIVKVFKIHSGGAVTQEPLSFGEFKWTPELLNVEEHEITDVDPVISHIERWFETEFGYLLWTEIDLLRKLRRVLEKGKSDTIIIPDGIFKCYRLNIHFCNEA